MELRQLCRLFDGLYVELSPGIGCLVESPRIEAGVCYTNTNYLALHALEICGSKLANPVQEFLRRHDHERSGRFEVLWLEPIPYPPQRVKRLVLGRASVYSRVVEIRADIPSGELLPDWHEYADLLMLAALERLRRGDRGGAASLRGQTLSLWDGSGFADKTFREAGLYETYKLSLYYFLARALRVEDEAYKKIPKIIERMVSSKGGIVTHYTENLKPRGDPNIETTSVTILAFYSDYPKVFAAKAGGSGGAFTPMRLLPALALLAVLALPAWRWLRLLSKQHEQQ